MHLGGATLARLCLARSLLELPDGPSVDDVARRVRLSRFHFIRQFEAAFGNTPCAYRTQVRLAVARVLLAQGKTVTEVCLEVGFSSLGTFSRTFHEIVGVSPSAYRRRSRENPESRTRAYVPGCYAMAMDRPSRTFGEDNGAERE